MWVNQSDKAIQEEDIQNKKRKAEIFSSGYQMEFQRQINFLSTKLFCFTTPQKTDYKVYKNDI